MQEKVIFQKILKNTVYFAGKGHIPECRKRSYFIEYDLFLHFDFQEGPQSGLFFSSSTAKFPLTIL